ncbi:T9SS type A sorting domain-containing protein [Candidatus Poribacteria bacterium]|nr:T9SS type A sorting domain-containing protein [Candidatus Poribacteria bacterium]MYK17941.1 T9SS type A sorting domain-containing protein [Candidatus Poribacteria bacterium]
MEGDIHGGNSGGPVLNGQGTLVGIITATDNETEGYAAPSRNIRALLNTVPANLDLIGHPREVFRIRNNTRVTVPYQIRWSSADDWEPNSIDTGFIKTHWSSGQRIVEGYPKIRFDHIAGDQVVTYRGYNLDTALFREGNNNHAPTYFFQFNRWGDRLDLYIDDLAAPMLSEAAPKETVLLSNYPNPFNPETWIPYQLAKPAEVTVTIYAADGKLVRRLALGHQPAGVYQSKSRAAYWDGKNDVGESVASGLYFYTLKAGEFTATRKMLIRK